MDCEHGILCSSSYQKGSFQALGIWNRKVALDGVNRGCDTRSVRLASSAHGDGQLMHIDGTKQLHQMSPMNALSQWEPLTVTLT